MEFNFCNRFRKAFLIFLGLLLGLVSLSAQYSIRGIVVDSETNEPLPFVSIMSECGLENTFSDPSGTYTLQLGNKSECTYTFVCVGFQPLQKTFTLGKTENIIDIYLNPITEEIEEVIVERTKYSRSEGVITTSVATLNTKQLELKNSVSLDKALESVPGLVIVDNEPQMRGGSGFSSGMGSRVMVMLDDMPLLRADAGRPAWNFIPMEDIEQIDIHKGAASVLYGSSALNGAINVRTAYPRDKPVTKINVHAGIYNKPGTALIPAERAGKYGSVLFNDKNTTYRTSWNRAVAPITFGLSAFHSRKSGNWDFVFGAEFLNDPGYIGPELSIEDTKNRRSIPKGKYEIRGRVNAAARYNFKKVKGLSVSLSGNAMYSDNGQTFFWMDGDTNMFRTYPGSLTYYKDVMAYIDPVVRYISDKHGMHVLRNRVFYSNNMAESPSNPTVDQTTRSVMVYNEYQYKQTYQKLGRLTLTAGIVNQYVYAAGNIFTGSMESIGDENGEKRQFSNNLGIYAELEKEFWNVLTLQAGFRYEFYKINNLVENKPIFRAGLNYHPIKSTNIRLSWGQGYRPPTIGERYIATRVGDYGFYPNPNLKSETSWNLELGIKQFYKFGSFQGFFDIAGYYQKYDNYCEINLDNWASTTINDISTFGFMFVNTGKAAVPGIDVAWTGQHKVNGNFEYMFMLAYNYCMPKTDNQEDVYYQFINNGIVKRELTYNNTSSDDSTGILKYRIQHLAKFDFDIVAWKRWDIGITLKYYSQMKNIDTYFYQYDLTNPKWGEDGNRFLEGIYARNPLPFKGVINERVLNQYGVLLFDARVGYSFGVFKVSLIGTNLFNKIYTMRPMYVEEPRKVTVQFLVKM